MRCLALLSCALPLGVKFADAATSEFSVRERAEHDPTQTSNCRNFRRRLDERVPAPWRQAAAASLAAALTSGFGTAH